MRLLHCTPFEYVYKYVLNYRARRLGCAIYSPIWLDKAQVRMACWACKAWAGLA
jgi:hypothetical protein